MAENVWNDILARVETKINRHSYYTWFKPTALVDENGERLRIRVPNSQFRDWLAKHYAGVINEAALEIRPAGVRIDFVTEAEAEAPPAAAEPPAPPGFLRRRQAC